jgi:surface antigen
MVSGARRGRLLLVTLLLLLTAGLVTVSGQAANAAISSNDYPSNLASAAKDTLTDPWSFYNRECTSFVAWRMNNDNGVAFSNNMGGGHWGDASNWWSNAATLGYTRDSTPTAGSIAYWSANYHGADSSGHVAYVVSVNSDGAIVIEDYNSLNDGNYDRRTIASGAGTWPYGFIHVKDLNDLLVARAGNNLYGKQGLNVGWTTIATDATDVQAAGNRIAYMTTGGHLKARDGLSGTTYDEATSVSQFAVTPSYLIVRFTDGTVYGKAGLSNGWTALDTSGTAVDIQASGTRIAFKNSSGYLKVKDTLVGSWVTETSGFSQYVITPSYLIVRFTDGTVYGKAGLSDPWSALDTTDAAADIQASGTRIAYKSSSSGHLYVKDTLIGSWYDETSSVSQYAVTDDNYLVIRQTNTLSGKGPLNDGWTTPLTTSASSFKATHARIAFLDSSNELWAKDGLNGGWYDELSSVDQYVIS